MEMTVAIVNVSGVVATANRIKLITRGIVGANVQIVYDSTVWIGLRKTVVFEGSGVTRDVLDAGEIVEIPPEVASEANSRIRMGIYGVSDDGSVVVPTIWAELGRVRDSADPSGDESTAPELPVWAQLDSRVKKLESQAPSDGDSSAFYIAISEENGSYVMDKTFPELKEAHEAGRPVYAIVNVTVENLRVNNAIFQFSNVFDAFFVFTHLENSILFTAFVNKDGISFRVKRYAEESSIPNKLPNPNALTFTGAVSGTYDGSDPVTIDIPNASGGNVDWLDPEEGEVFTAIVNTPDEPDIPDIPDEPDVPEVTLSGISATYTGGNVAVGTAVSTLKGITVTAHYSDGSTATVTDYSLSGTIAEGSNTITVSYGGKTTTFTVTGEAGNINLGDYPVYLETINGVEYIVTTDRSLISSHGTTSDSLLYANSYKNDTYTLYKAPLYGSALIDYTVTPPYGGVVPFAEETSSFTTLLNYAEEGEYCGGPGNNFFRLYNYFGEYENVNDYYWGKYGVFKVPLLSTVNKKTIDPSLITSITIKTNDDTWQQASFGYSDCPDANITTGFNTLTFHNGNHYTNLNACTRACAVLSTSALVIKFKPGTFEDFTLDAVKAFLTEHPLTFIY